MFPLERGRSFPLILSRTAKKAMRTQPTSGATKRSNSAGSSAAGLNIQQKISLSSEQQKVLTHVVAEGKNIFFTGSAGMTTESSVSQLNRA